MVCERDPRSRSRRGWPRYWHTGTSTPSSRPGTSARVGILELSVAHGRPGSAATSDTDS